MKRLRLGLGMCIMAAVLGAGCGLKEKEVGSVDEMQGELLQNSAEIEKKDLEAEKELEQAGVEEKVFEVSMTEVSETLCPTTVSMKKPDVDYGEVIHFTYYSNTTSCERKANILLPKDYDSSKKYSVLYFLHGIFGDENSMIKDGNNKLDIILGNLKKDGLCGDVIVVFPDMYATGDPNLKPGFNEEQVAPYDNFINDLSDDLIPYIENNYSVYTDREHRGLIGFSMGGRETLFIGLMRSDLFDAMGAIAPAPGVVPAKDWAMEHKGQLSVDELKFADGNPLPKLFMICCGTKDSVVGKFPVEYHDILVQNEVEHLWYEVPEADHDSNAIRSGFYNFLIRWFH